MAHRAEPCQDPRLALGAGISAVASALVSLACEAPVAAAVQLAAAGIMLGSAGWALRTRAPAPTPAPATEARPDLVAEAIELLGGRYGA